MKRINLKSKNLSPNQRRIRLQELSGIPISEKNKKRILNETVSQVLPMRLGDRNKIQSSMLKSMEVDEFDDEVSDEEVDLNGILREMGYSDEEDLRDDIDEDEGEDDNVGNMSRTELKQLIQGIVLDTMEEEDDLNEIIENITKN
tara:strand:- start:166 stop:600 length:435 start_codon:yes stop_codon:yes gene_type:complete